MAIPLIYNALSVRARWTSTIVAVLGIAGTVGVFVWMLRPMGVPDEASFALSTLIIVTGLAGNIPGLVLWLRQDREIL